MPSLPTTLVGLLVQGSVSPYKPAAAEDPAAAPERQNGSVGADSHEVVEVIVPPQPAAELLHRNVHFG